MAATVRIVMRSCAIRSVMHCTDDPIRSGGGAVVVVCVVVCCYLQVAKGSAPKSSPAPAGSTSTGSGGAGSLGSGEWLELKTQKGVPYFVSRYDGITSPSYLLLTSLCRCALAGGGDAVLRASCLFSVPRI